MGAPGQADGRAWQICCAGQCGPGRGADGPGGSRRPADARCSLGARSRPWPRPGSPLPVPKLPLTSKDEDEDKHKGFRNGLNQKITCLR